MVEIPSFVNYKTIKFRKMQNRFAKSGRIRPVTRSQPVTSAPAEPVQPAPAQHVPIPTQASAPMSLHPFIISTKRQRAAASAPLTTASAPLTTASAPLTTASAPLTTASAPSPAAASPPTALTTRTRRKGCNCNKQSRWSKSDHSSRFLKK